MTNIQYWTAILKESDKPLEDRKDISKDVSTEAEEIEKSEKTNETDTANTDDNADEKIKESLDKDEIVNRAFEHLLYFASGKGNAIMNDSEWFNDVKNCINAAVQLKAFRPEAESKKMLVDLNTLDDED